MAIPKAVPALRRLLGHQGGASAVEFALLTPIALLLLMGSVTLFDLFRHQQNAEKATFTVGDILSRDTAIGGGRVNDMLALLKNMVVVAVDGGLRVSSVVQNSSGLQIVWTQRAGNTVPMPATVDLSKVPTLAVGDSVLITETFAPHRAMFAGFSVDRIIYHNVAITRPRFVQRIAQQ